MGTSEVIIGIGYQGNLSEYCNQIEDLLSSLNFSQYFDDNYRVFLEDVDIELVVFYADAIIWDINSNEVKSIYNLLFYIHSTNPNAVFSVCLNNKDKITHELGDWFEYKYCILPCF